MLLRKRSQGSFQLAARPFQNAAHPKLWDFQKRADFRAGLAAKMKVFHHLSFHCGQPRKGSAHGLNNSPIEIGCFFKRRFNKRTQTFDSEFFWFYEHTGRYAFGFHPAFPCVSLWGGESGCWEQNQSYITFDLAQNPPKKKGKGQWKTNRGINKVKKG